MDKLPFRCYTGSSTGVTHFMIIQIFYSILLKSRYSIVEQGFPTPEPWTAASPWPVAARATQLEMSGDHGLHRAIRTAHLLLCRHACVSFAAHSFPTMSSNEQDRGQEERQIGMERSSHPLLFE